MDLDSIRSKVIIIFIPLIVVPLLVSGLIGALYFQDVIKHKIWDDDLGQAKAISALTTGYVELSENYLMSIADRPLVIKAVEERSPSFLNETAAYTAVQSIAFDSVFITDSSGEVMSYHTMYANQSYPGIIGKSLLDRPYVGQALRMSRPVTVAMRNDIYGSSSIYVGVPIRDSNNTTIGTIVGTYDMGNFSSAVIVTSAKSSHYIYLINGSGNVIVHSNRSFMGNMADFTPVPVVKDVIHGKEGVAEQYNPIEKDDRLVAYYPVNNTGWGVVVAMPTSIAYQPVTNVLWVVSAITLAVAAISLALAYVFGKSITDPIMGLYSAARAITNRQEYRQYLPVKRKDEIGQVAVCMDRMAQRINEDRQRIMEEKNRAELYLDIMGHDINNLNQVTIGNLELIADDKNLTPLQRESVSEALNAARGSASIIDNVRKIQAINEGRASMQPEDINAMILQCIESAPRPEGRNVKINYSPRSRLMIMGTMLMREVFCNLIGNAIKHSNRDVTVDVRVDDVDRYGRKFYDVSISDNGQGIPEDVKRKLFSRFQRGATKAHGKGLGLFIVKSLVEQAGGDVTVGDRVPGDFSKGAKFTVSLPVCEGAR